MNRLLEQLKRNWIRSALNLLLMAVFLVHVSTDYRLGVIDRLENLLYDARLLVTMPNTVEPSIVIVDIDEKSLGEEGRWPWSRNKMARLVDSLFDYYGIGILGFDVVFAEPDESSGLKILEALADEELKGDARFARALDEMSPRLNYDQVFARSLQGRPVVMGYYFSSTGTGEEVLRVGSLPKPTLRAGHFRGRNIPFITANGYGANLPELQQAAVTAGHFNPFIDEDGVVRRVTMLYEYEDAHYESLSLAMARLALGVNKLEPRYADKSIAGKSYSGLEWLRIGKRLVPVDDRVRSLVPYRGKKGSFAYIPAADVLQKRTPAGDLKGKIVLVGTTAPGLLDLRSAPVQKVFPGVEIHANLIAGILYNTVKEMPAYTLGAEFIILVLAGMILTIAYAFMGPGKASMVTLAVVLTVLIINFLVWEYGNLVLPLAASVTMAVVMFVLSMSYGFFVEARGKRELATVFGQYVPPELVEEMGDSPEEYSLDAESRDLTVLFSDVRGFTTISEGLDPQDLSRLMNHFLTPLTGVIHKHRGTIDKYMGDAIMAFWGAPIDDPDHSRHALQAGLEMVETLDKMQGEFHAQGWPEVRIGVGLNTGPMSVGNMGSEFRMAYTVLGDAVNLGSRLEGLTRQYAVDIIVSENTKEALPDYMFRELDRVRVKGKDKPVAIFEPIGPKNQVDQETRNELKLYKETLRLYRTQNWDIAEIQFLNLRKMNPGRKLYEIYSGRVAHFRQKPPGEGWDGVFTFKTK